MKSKKILLGMLVLTLVFGFLLTACSPDDDSTEDESDGGSKRTTITLTLEKWADGAISSEGGEQWFKFTATAGKQYLHVSFGTLTDVNIQLYDSKEKELGNRIVLVGDTGDSKNALLTLTSGQVYYLKVIGGWNRYTGTYRICFNTMQYPPDTFSEAETLTANNWVDGAITSSIKEQWYKFRATANTQYLHVSFGTMNNINVQLHDDTGNTLGNAIHLVGDTKYTSLTVTSGQMYYVRVTSGGYSYGSSDTGTYRIGFNTTQWTLGILEGAETLTNDTWADGSISETSTDQWFKFTAIAGTQYLHVSFGTMNNINVQLHNNTGDALGNAIHLVGNTKYTSLAVTSGQMYYVRVTKGGYSYGSSDTGTYKIALNTSTTAPVD